MLVKTIWTFCTRAVDPHSSIHIQRFFLCGSGSGCFLTADPDLVQKTLLFHKVFCSWKRQKRLIRTELKYRYLLVGPNLLNFKRKKITSSPFSCIFFLFLFFQKWKLIHADPDPQPCFELLHPKPKARDKFGSGKPRADYQKAGLRKTDFWLYM